MKVDKIAEQEYPHACVGAMIFNKDGRFLLVKSHKFHDMFVIPGGHIELGEKAEDALAREIKEETGLHIFDIKYLGIQEFIFDKAFYKKRHFIFLDYACRTDSEVVVLNDEAQDHAWVTTAESKYLPVEPYTRKTIKMYEKRQAEKHI